MHSHSRSAHTHSYSQSISDGPFPAISPVGEESEELDMPPFSTGVPPNGGRRKSRYTNGQTSSPSVLYQELTGISTEPASGHNHNHSHDHDHDHDDHTHGCQSGHIAIAKPAEPRSRVTNLLLRRTKTWSLIQSILLEKDSRRIFYFMTYVSAYPLSWTTANNLPRLNFAFMIVQAFYGFATDSLGLLSDSIHMFFDCIALGLGLFAAVASKWPPSQRFPYGFGKIESLAGFGNGVFLM